MQYLGFIIPIVVTYLAHKEYKDLGDGYMTYGKGLSIGTLVALISSFINGAFIYIYVSFVSDQRIVDARENALFKLEEQGQSDAQIEMAMPWIEKTTTPLAVFIFALIFGVFSGFIISLVVSAFTKKVNTNLNSN